MRGGDKSDPHARLLRGFLAMAGKGSEILSSSSKPWASATFTGATHLAWMRITGAHVERRLAALVKRLPDAEFQIPGHVVVDVVVLGHAAHRNEAWLDVGALTVEDW